MNRQDLVALAPLVALGGGCIVLLLAIAWRRNHRAAAFVAASGLVAALATLPAAMSEAPRQVTPLLLVDGYALLFVGLICAAALITTALAFVYFEHREMQRDEFYLLLLLATLGAAVLAESVHAASLFLGLEVLSVSLYAMIGYSRDGRRPIEASLKYLILAAASSSFLLFGLALIYARYGSLELEVLSDLIASQPEGLLALAGLGMLVTGIGFKLALVPFHLWTPDVYAGAPAPVTAFVASVSKAAVFAFVLRVVTANGEVTGKVFWSIGLIAVASMVIGNLLALLQNNVKRILAYSSIAHLGYLLVALLSATELGVEAAIYYLVAYVVTILGAFAVVTLLSDAEGEAEGLAAYRGLFWRRPALAAFFSAVLFSLAGIPLTAGFLGKFYVLAAGVDAGLWWLVVALVVNSAVGLFYYLRLVVAMFAEPDVGADQADQPQAAGRAGTRMTTVLSTGTLALLTLALVWFGVYPATLVDWIQRLVVGGLP